MEDDEIIEKLRKFLEDKQRLDVQSCYFISKKLNEEYWDEITQGTSETEEDAAEEDAAEEDDDGDFDDEKPKKSAEVIKRPKIRIK